MDRKVRCLWCFAWVCRSLTERLETATTALKAAEVLIAHLPTSTPLILPPSTTTHTLPFHAWQSSDQESRSRAACLEQEVGELKEWAKRAAKETKAAEAKLRLQLQDAQDALANLKAEHDDDRTRHRIQVRPRVQEKGRALPKVAEKGGRGTLTQPFPFRSPDDCLASAGGGSAQGAGGRAEEGAVALRPALPQPAPRQRQWRAHAELHPRADYRQRAR